MSKPVTGRVTIEAKDFEQLLRIERAAGELADATDKLASAYRNGESQNVKIRLRRHAQEKLAAFRLARHGELKGSEQSQTGKVATSPDLTAGGMPCKCGRASVVETESAVEAGDVERCSCNVCNVFHFGATRVEAVAGWNRLRASEAAR